NSEKGIVIDFEGVSWVCSDFSAHLARHCDDAATKGLAVAFVNVADTIKPYIDVQAITQGPEPRRSVLTISTKEVLEDIERNLPNRDLMDKYGLSLNGLTALFRKLFNKGLITRQWMERRHIHDPIEIDLAMGDLRKTEIPAVDVLKDIADDMPDETLMQKYRLSQKELDSMWMQLFENNLISEETLRQRSQQKKGQP